MLTVLCTNELIATYFYSQYIITKSLHGQGETKMVVTPTLAPLGARYAQCDKAGEKLCALPTFCNQCGFIQFYMDSISPWNEVCGHQHPFLQDGDLTLKS